MEPLLTCSGRRTPWACLDQQARGHRVRAVCRPRTLCPWGRGPLRPNRASRSGGSRLFSCTRRRAELLDPGVIPRPQDQGRDRQTRHAATPGGPAHPQGADAREVAGLPVRRGRGPGPWRRGGGVPVLAVGRDAIPLLFFLDLHPRRLLHRVADLLQDRAKQGERPAGVVPKGGPDVQEAPPERTCSCAEVSEITRPNRGPVRAAPS